MTALKEERYADEGWRTRKDGSRFVASVVIEPVKDDNGVAIGFASVTRDITARRQAEDELTGSPPRAGADFTPDHRRRDDRIHRA